MLIAFISIIAGALLVIKSNWIVNTFGYVDFAEKYLRIYGGTRTFWKLLGIIIIIISFLYIGGLLEPIILWFFGPTIRGLQ